MSFAKSADVSCLLQTEVPWDETYVLNEPTPAVPVQPAAEDELLDDPADAGKAAHDSI